MNFREFLRIDELFDLSSADTSGVEFNRVSNQNYEYKFVHDGQVYTIDMTRETFLSVPLSADGAWGISFFGPSGLDLTGIAGMSATVIYRNLLLAVKKLMEIEEVNTLYFSPAQERMLAMYDIFYRKYLKPEPPAGPGFVRIDQHLYSRRDFLVAHNYINDESKKKMFNADKEVEERLEKINKQREVVRSLRREMALNKVAFRRFNNTTDNSMLLVLDVGLDGEDYDGFPLIKGYKMYMMGPKPMILGSDLSPPKSFSSFEISNKLPTIAEIMQYKWTIRILMSRRTELQVARLPEGIYK